MLKQITINTSIRDEDWYLVYGFYFINLIFEAATKDHLTKLGDTDQVIEVKRGQVPLSITYLAKEMKTSFRRYKTFLTRLQKAGELDLSITNKGSLITLKKYDFWTCFSRETVKNAKQESTHSDIEDIKDTEQKNEPIQENAKQPSLPLLDTDLDLDLYGVEGCAVRAVRTGEISAKKETDSIVENVDPENSIPERNQNQKSRQNPDSAITLLKYSDCKYEHKNNNHYFTLSFIEVLSGVKRNRYYTIKKNKETANTMLDIIRREFPLLNIELTKSDGAKDIYRKILEARLTGIIVGYAELDAYGNIRNLVAAPQKQIEALETKDHRIEDESTQLSCFELIASWERKKRIDVRDLEDTELKDCISAMVKLNNSSEELRQWINSDDERKRIYDCYNSGTNALENRGKIFSLFNEMKLRQDLDLKLEV